MLFVFLMQFSVILLRYLVVPFLLGFCLESVHSGIVPLEFEPACFSSCNVVFFVICLVRSIVSLECMEPCLS